MKTVLSRCLLEGISYEDQVIPISDGSFAGSLRVPLTTKDIKVTLETTPNAIGEKGRIAFTLKTDLVPLPPESINLEETELQYGGFTVGFSGVTHPLQLDVMDVYTMAKEGLYLPASFDPNVLDKVVVELFGKQLSLTEDAPASLRFIAQDANLGGIVVQFLATEFTGNTQPTKLSASVSAENKYGGAALQYQFIAYKEGGLSYQGYRKISLVETAVNSLIFKKLTLDYGSVIFSMTGSSGSDPLLKDTLDGNLTWTLPVIGSSQGQLVETEVNSGLFRSISSGISAAQNELSSMLIITGIENDKRSFGGKSTSYQMLVPKMDVGTSQKVITLTDSATGQTHDLHLEDELDSHGDSTGYYITKEFTVLDKGNNGILINEHIVPSTSTELNWTVHLGQTEGKGVSKKMTAEVRPNPTTEKNYTWAKSDFFAGPFWLWGDDLKFDGGLFEKEGLPDSEGLLKVKFANNFNRVTVKIYPASVNEEGVLVRAGEALFERNYSQLHQVKAGEHRFWNGKVNRVKGGPKAVDNYVPPKFKPHDETVVDSEGEKYPILAYNPKTKTVTVKRGLDGKELEGPLAKLEKIPANVGKVTAWWEKVQEEEKNHKWEQEQIKHDRAHPYFLDPEFGDCLVEVTGEYTNDNMKLEITKNIRVRGHAKKYFLYVERDQKFHTEAESPRQAASDAVAYQWAGFIQPANVKKEGQAREEPNSKAGELLASRHTAQQKENEIIHINTPVALDGLEDWRFYDAFKRLTQRGEIVILTHGNTLWFRLEKKNYEGFHLQKGETPVFSGNTYPLPELNLNTVKASLFSCFSGTQAGGQSSASQLLSILDKNPNGIKNYNKVVAFDGLSSAGGAGYYIRYKRRFPNNANINHKLVHDRYSAILDGWNGIISASGVTPAEPADFLPYSAVANEKLTERWTMILVNDFGDTGSFKDFNPPSVQPNTSLKADSDIRMGEYWRAFPFPPTGGTQAAEIWEISKGRSAGTAKGNKKLDITYSGIGQNGLTGVQGITAQLEPAEGKMLVLRIPGRGGNRYFARYALDKYKIEENQLPANNGAPGGDRMKHLRLLHNGITVPDMQPKDIADIGFWVNPLKHDTKEHMKNKIILTSP